MAGAACNLEGIKYLPQDLQLKIWDEFVSGSRYPLAAIQRLRDTVLVPLKESATFHDKQLQESVLKNLHLLKNRMISKNPNMSLHSHIELSRDLTQEQIDQYFFQQIFIAFKEGPFRLIEKEQMHDFMNKIKEYDWKGPIVEIYKDFVNILTLVYLDSLLHIEELSEEQKTIILEKFDDFDSINPENRMERYTRYNRQIKSEFKVHFEKFLYEDIINYLNLHDTIGFLSQKQMFVLIFQLIKENLEELSKSLPFVEFGIGELINEFVNRNGEKLSEITNKFVQYKCSTDKESLTKFYIYMLSIYCTNNMNIKEEHIERIIRETLTLSKKNNLLKLFIFSAILDLKRISQNQLMPIPETFKLPQLNEEQTHLLTSEITGIINDLAQGDPIQRAFGRFIENINAIALRLSDAADIETIQITKLDSQLATTQLVQNIVNHSLEATDPIQILLIAFLFGNVGEDLSTLEKAILKLDEAKITSFSEDGDLMDILLSAFFITKAKELNLPQIRSKNDLLIILSNLYLMHGNYKKAMEIISKLNITDSTSKKKVMHERIIIENKIQNHRERTRPRMIEPMIREPVIVERNSLLHRIGRAVRPVFSSFLKISTVTIILSSEVMALSMLALSIYNHHNDPDCAGSAHSNLFSDIFNCSMQTFGVNKF